MEGGGDETHYTIDSATKLSKTKRQNLDTLPKLLPFQDVREQNVKEKRVRSILFFLEDPPKIFNTIH